MQATLRNLLPVVALSVTLSSVASAGPINGSLGLSFFQPDYDGTTLADTTLLSDVNTPTNGNFDEDYAIIPQPSTYTGFTLDLSTLATGGGFTISLAGFGSFVATGGQLISQDTNFLDVYLLGTYSGLPNPSAPGGCGTDPCDGSPNNTSFRASFNLSGTSLSGSGTLVSPPASLVPEPGTMVLLGGALVAAGVIRRRRTA